MMTATQIVERCGGTSALAESLGLTPSTVSSWKSANHIPRWWHTHILTAAASNGKPFSATDFPPKPPRAAKEAA